MKKILAKLFGGVGSNIAEKISNIIDKHTFSKVEKAEFEKEMTEVWINAEADIQKNITDRWKNDMNSDSWLSKNVRPIVLLFLVISTVLMVFIDAGIISFEVKDNWVDLLQMVLITVIGAYFGGRSYEKIKKL
jgi:cation transport ATPase